MINAVFNHSNFWDGRAHFLFNGASPIGPLDPNARIWVNPGAAPGGTPVAQTVRFPSSSLASQAVGPPTSDLEMSFFNRPFAMIGRKLLGLGVTPLGSQLVDPTDSVLGPLSGAPLPGLNTTYTALIQAAFAPKYWNGGQVQIGGQQFSQMEANFTLFWGLAVQRYEQTLVSDRTPFDRFMEGSNTALNQQQLQGLLTFINQGAKGNLPGVDAAIGAAQSALGVKIGAGNCLNCHGGPAFTEAADLSIELEDTAKLVNGLLALDTPGGGLLDNGFANIGARTNNDDRGRGGTENGFPLSFVRQARNPNLNFLLTGTNTIGLALPCNAPGVAPALNSPTAAPCSARDLTDGAFKVPDLRNVELTGPYFHNGGQATLHQVVKFYERQSDFAHLNITNLDGNLVFIDLANIDEGPLVAFLLSLTDNRVRNEQAPFDHPQILVPNGGTFGAEQPPMVVPAVGAGGRPARGSPPLGTFLGLAP
jgi:cytochrome c peroxidase